MKLLSPVARNATVAAISSIANYVLTIANGMTVRAVGGATREDLLRVADSALRNWPPR